MSQQSLETRWAPVQAALERAAKKQRANPIGEKLDKIEGMLRAWLAADSDEVGDEARAASLAALHARIEAEGLLDAIKAHEKETNAALSKLNKAAEKAFPPIDHAVPVELVVSIAGLRHGGASRFLNTLLRYKLVHHENTGAHDGYRLTCCVRPRSAPTGQ